MKYQGIELTEELCEVIGAFMGDGCAYNSKKCHYNIQFTGHSELDLEYYQNKVIPIISKIFSAKGIIRKVKNKNAIRINFYSKSLYNFLNGFLNLNSKPKTYSIAIPNIMFNKENKQCLSKLIRGLYDTDGGIYLDRRKRYSSLYPRIIFSTSSVKLRDQILKYIGNYFSYYTFTRKNSSKKSESFYIDIYGTKNISKWIDLIGFSNSRHLSKVALLAQQV